MDIHKDQSSCMLQASACTDNVQLADEASTKLSKEEYKTIKHCLDIDSRYGVLYDSVHGDMPKTTSECLQNLQQAVRFMMNTEILTIHHMSKKERDSYFALETAILVMPNMTLSDHSDITSNNICVNNNFPVAETTIFEDNGESTDYVLLGDQVAKYDFSQSQEYNYHYNDRYVGENIYIPNEEIIALLLNKMHSIFQGNLLSKLVKMYSRISALYHIYDFAAEACCDYAVAKLRRYYGDEQFEDSDGEPLNDPHAQLNWNDNFINEIRASFDAAFVNPYFFPEVFNLVNSKDQALSSLASRSINNMSLFSSDNPMHVIQYHFYVG